jgi:urease accessory protein
MATGPVIPTGMTRPTMPTETGRSTMSPHLLALMWLASPALPVGGFSYSEGLEAAVDSGRVHDEESASDWLVDQLHLALARADLAVIGHALPAWQRREWDQLLWLDGWVRQTRESAEFRLQSEQMGRSLMEWLRSLRRPDIDLATLPQALQSPTYPVAWALALSMHSPPDAPVADGLLAYAFGWAENMVQAAIKSIPLGQGSGQRVLARLCAEIPEATLVALATPIDDLQAFTPMLAILSARHETQYSRLFRS